MPFPSKFIFEDNVSIEGKDPFEIKDVSLKKKKKDTHTTHKCPYYKDLSELGE